MGILIISLLHIGHVHKLHPSVFALRMPSTHCTAHNSHSNGKLNVWINNKFIVHKDVKVRTKIHTKFQCNIGAFSHNTLFNATQISGFVDTKRADEANNVEVKNITQVGLGYLHTRTLYGKCKNSIGICSIFLTMWVQFYINFPEILFAKGK